MARIVELSPVYSQAGHPDFLFVQGSWNSGEQTRQVALLGGHDYVRPAEGGVTAEDADRLLAGADALVLAPTLLWAAAMTQPADGDAAGRELGHRILDRVAAARPSLPVVLASHFLVGHGAAHRNAKPNTWALRALEAHLRAGPNPWTVLRATWLSTVHEPSYQIRFTQDQNADGLVSTESIGRAVVAAIEFPAAAAGRTAAVFNLSVPPAGPTETTDQLAARLAALRPDFEAAPARVPA
jgi:hypothetical protein